MTTELEAAKAFLGEVMESARKYQANTPLPEGTFKRTETALKDLGDTFVALIEKGVPANEVAMAFDFWLQALDARLKAVTSG